MSTLSTILAADFLLRDALLASVLVGMVCPLVGVYFILRRMIFLGVALPQVSAAGVAFSFLVYRVFAGPHQQVELGERMLGLIGSGVFTMTTTLVLAMLERNGRERIEARIGATYAFAAAATILFLSADPHGDAEIVGLLKGDILATTSASLNVMTWIFAGVLLALFTFRKELLLVSFDRDLAVVFGKRVVWWDVVLYLLIGAVISLGVMAAGPLATFGFLVIPPLTMRLVTRRMLTFSLGSSALGGVVAFVGFYLAYGYDLPLAPAEVAVASFVLVVVGAATGVRRAAVRWRTA
jgi:ABC-type Mn2+/Zn2+ transport system permease subunit